MRKDSFFFLLLILMYFPVQAQQRISLQEAVNQKLVAIQVRGNGGFSGKCIKLAVKNTSNKVVSLEVPAGHVFASEDSSVQDLMVTEPAYLALAANKVKSHSLYGMCTQSSNVGPKKGEKFNVGKMAEGHLLKLAQKIAKGGYQNSTAQSAVWSVANQANVRNIYGEDTAMVRDIAQVVSDASGVPLSDFVLQPRVHRITTINTSLEGVISKKLNNAKLVLQDQNGNTIRRYFENRTYEKGFIQWKLGASHTLGDEAELYLNGRSIGAVRGLSLASRKRLADIDGAD